MTLAWPVDIVQVVLECFTENMLDIQIHVHYEIMKSKVPRAYVWLGHHCILKSQHSSWPEYMSDNYFLNESLLHLISYQFYPLYVRTQKFGDIHSL